MHSYGIMFGGDPWSTSYTKNARNNAGEIVMHFANRCEKAAYSMEIHLRCPTIDIFTPTLSLPLSLSLSMTWHLFESGSRRSPRFRSSYSDIRCPPQPCTISPQSYGVRVKPGRLNALHISPPSFELPHFSAPTRP